MWWLVLAACTQTAEPPPAEVAPPADEPPPLEAPVDEVSAVAPAEPPRCPQVFTEEHSNQYFAKLSGVAGDDGCEFEGVRTRSSTMGVEWKKGETIHAWTLEPAGCAEAATVTHGELALTADEAARGACPKKWDATVELIKSGGLPSPQKL